MKTPIRLISPCPVPGSRLGELERSRRCPTCDHVVTNLSALAPEEADRAVAADGGMCAQLWRGWDGRVRHLAGAALVGLAACAHTQEPMPEPVGEPTPSGVLVPHFDTAQGQLEVRVRTDDGASIPGALVSARRPDGLVLQVATDAEGKATVPVPVGYLEWTVEKPGFRTVMLAGTLGAGAEPLQHYSHFLGRIEVPKVTEDDAPMTTTMTSDTLSRLPPIAR